MNARTPNIAVETPFDVTDVEAVEAKAPVTALVPVVKNVLEITEVLDAKAKDGENAIVTITPLQYDVTGATLAALHEKYAGATFDVDTPEGRTAAKATVSELNRIMKGMEDAYKAWNGPIMAMTKHARTQKDKVTEALDTLKKPIVAALEAVKKAEEEAEAKRAAVESARISMQETALATLRAMPDTFVAASSADIAAKLAEMSSFEFLAQHDWQEFGTRAAEHQREGIEKLKQHHANALAREQLETLRAEQAAADAKRAADAALAERIQKITMAPMSVFGKPAADMRSLITRLDGTDTATFGDKAAEAKTAIDTAREMVKTMLAQAELAEAQAAAAQAQADELASIKAADAQREAEAARKVAEQAQAAKEQAAKEQRATEAREQAIRDTAANDARIARERAEAQAETMLALLIEALPVVTIHCETDLHARIEVAIAAATGA